MKFLIDCVGVKKMGTQIAALQEAVAAVDC